MRIVFVVPYALETTLRFVRAMLALPDVHVAVLSQEAASALPADIRRQLVAHHRLEDPLDAEQLAQGVRVLGTELGGRVDRLIGILEQLQEPLGEVRERLGIRGMSLDEARNFRDKARMKDMLAAAGLPCARHFLASTREAALDFARECLPLVAKPPAGAGARNTVRVNTLEELESYLRSLPPSPAEPLLLEEFVQGREHSFDTISVNGTHVFHSISSYYPTPLEVMENPWLQWCVILPRDIDVPEFADIHSAGGRALDALGMRTGLTHMEWFRREDGTIAISEVGARPPGAQFTTLISYAHDMDLYHAWAELMVFERFKIPERRFAVGAIFLRGQGGASVQAVQGIEQAKQELGDLIVQARVPRAGQPAAQTYEGEGFVIVRHPETQAVEQALKRLFELIRVELG